MNTLKLLFGIALLASSTLVATGKDKLVKSENINGKITPVVTLKTIEVSATRKEVKLNGSMIADKTFASTKANFVRMIYVNKKLVPLVTLKTVEVIASRNNISSNDPNSTNATTSIENTNCVKTTLFNGELMPSVELNTAEVVSTRTEQSMMNMVTIKVCRVFSTTFNHFRIK